MPLTDLSVGKAVKRNIMLSEEEDEASPEIVKLNSIKQAKAKPESPTQTSLKQNSTTQIIGQKSLVMIEEEQEEVNNFKIKKTPQNKEDKAELPPVIQLSEYELQVQKNIAERAKLLESLGVFTAKEELLEVSQSLKVAEKTLYRGIAREPPKSDVIPKEIRRSLRQKNITPDSLLFRRSLRQQKRTPDGSKLTLPYEKTVAQTEASSCSRPSRPSPGKRVLKNGRNCWVKAQKKCLEGKTSGASVNTTKKYVYGNRLSILKKNIIPRETESNFTAENVESTESDDTEHCVSCSAEESSTPRVVKEKRKWKLDDIEKIIIDSLQTREDRHLSFFKGILPTLQQLSEEQTLQFQMGVLNLLQNIRNGQSFGQSSPSYSQPMQYNDFCPTPPNKFYPTPASSSTNLVGTNFQRRNNPSPNAVDNLTNHQEYIRPTSPNPSEMSDHLNIDFTTLT